jgi:hypothetical protein
MHPLIHLKRATPVFLVALALACFGLLSAAQAVIPAPDGGYPGGNTAEGQAALVTLTTGGFNTAVGFLSLSANTTNSFNTAIGAGTLLANTADSNTATGAGALLRNTTGVANTADGTFALFSNTTGNINTAVGLTALGNNTTGSNNTALGTEAGTNVITANNVTCLGAGVIGDNINNTTWIANVFATSTISGTTQPVIVSDTGQLGTISSSRRFKKEIKPMDSTSEAILALKPVTFHYKSDAKNTPCFGLIAEEVAKVNPALIVRDKEGKPYSVRYDQVNAMLLNEFLKEHKTVRQQGATIARLEKQIHALTAGLQKVSAQLELSKPEPQTVLNNQ